MVHSFFAVTRTVGLFLLLTVPAIAAGPVKAQAGERVMVVFDASGSMWGQIEGKSKIEIARGVLKRTLKDWKGLDMEAGLVVYGHRRKGDCGDIQTLIPSGPIDTGAFSRAVDAINPKGKTPLTAAVRAAAEELKYTEEKATVILMSDGKETCDVDPCAVATELERKGVDFTAHVIGFDVAKEAERKQLQCLAENTGGLFVLAKDANELSVAFERVTEPSPLTITAVNKADGREVPGPVNWSLKGGELTLDKTTETARLELPDVPDGRYALNVAAGPFKGQGTFELAEQRPPALSIELVADTPKASVAGPDTAPAADPFEVTWTGPAAKGDKIQLARPGSVPGSSFIQSFDASEGSPLTFKAPGKQGTYELRYYSGALKKLLVQRPIRVGGARPTAFMEALDKIPVGSVFEVKWTGPGHKSDRLHIAVPKAKADQYHSKYYVKRGNPLSLRAPSQPGVYEIRYFNGTDRKIMGRRVLDVVPADLALEAVDRVPAGSTFEVKWRGPGHKSDRVHIASPKNKADQYKSKAYVKKGNPLSMRAPSQPGTYELRYFNGSDRRVMFRQPLVVEAGGGELAAVRKVQAGHTFEVKWTGPGHKRDWLSIAKPKTKDGQHLSYVYVRQGNPLTLRAPSQPGTYELRYVNGSETKVMQRSTLVVEPADMGLEAVEGVAAGHTFEVKWSGPGHKRDWLAVAAPKAKDGKHLSYVYVRQGNPLMLRAPSQPGTYEVRYVNGSETRVMARHTLEVGPSGASLQAVNRIAAGHTFEVQWKGPGHKRDWVAIAKPGMKPGQRVSYVYVQRGATLEMRAPSEPGTYELRYVNGSETQLLAKRPLIVGAGGVSVDVKN